MERAELFKQIRLRLQDHFGSRFDGVLLYGSQARGDATPDSDIDLMVILKGPMLGGELAQIIRVIYPLQLEIESPIHVLPVDSEVFAAGEYAIYRHAKEEGIFL